MWKLGIRIVGIERNLKTYCSSVLLLFDVDEIMELGHVACEEKKGLLFVLLIHFRPVVLWFHYFFLSPSLFSCFFFHPLFIFLVL